MNQSLKPIISQMVLLLDDIIDPFHYIGHNLPFPTPEAVPLIPSYYFKLAVLEFLGEIVEVELKLVLDLLAGQVAIGHGQPGIHA